MRLRPPISTLFPYTTLFRSGAAPAHGERAHAVGKRRRENRTIAGATQVRRDAPGQLLGAEELRSEEHTSELQSHHDLVCRLLLEKKKKILQAHIIEQYIE